jgi:WD40 repeat protein
MSLFFSPRDKILAAGESQRVTLWNTETWTEIRPPLAGATFPVRFSPDGAWLITGTPASSSPQYRLWRTDTWEAVAACSGTPEMSWNLRNAVAFSPDGTLRSRLSSIRPPRLAVCGYGMFPRSTWQT